jgi:hypothetical protein
MKKASTVLAAVCATLLSSSESFARTLDALIPGLYGGDGILLATNPAANHAAHFAIGSAASINRLNEQITAEIGVFPFSSSVGGFTFAFDPVLGTFVRTTETLGPLFAERAPTLGRGRLNVHASFTFFKYDTFSDRSLDDLQVVARHDFNTIGFPDVPEQFENDTVLINVDLAIRVQILALAATYGLTDRLDVGVFIPITRVEMDVQSTARVVASPQNTLFPGVHTFVGGSESPNDAASGSAIGLGDMVLRAKYHVLKGEVVDIATAMLIKLATGDERDFLGTGDTTVRPFLVLSRTFFGLLTPHVNIGYEFNLRRSHQNAVEYALGFDLGLKRFTVAGEFLSSHELSGDGIGDHVLTASVGVKWNPWKRFLLAANAQFPLNRSGLRSDLIPTFSVEYSF